MKTFLTYLIIGFLPLFQFIIEPFVNNGSVFEII